MVYERHWKALWLLGCTSKCFALVFYMSNTSRWILRIVSFSMLDSQLLNLPFRIQNWLILPWCFFSTLLICMPLFPLVCLAPVDTCFGLFKDYCLLSEEVALRSYLSAYLNTRFGSLNLILIFSVKGKWFGNSHCYSLAYETLSRWGKAGKRASSRHIFQQFVFDKLE